LHAISHQALFQHRLTRFVITFFLWNVISSTRKDQKKVDKLEAQIPYHEGRGNLEEVTKIKDQVAGIWEKAREAQFA
jgi:hypothetical protein